MKRVLQVMGILVACIALLGICYACREAGYVDGEPAWCSEYRGEQVMQYVEMRDHGKTAEERATGLSGLGYRMERG